MGEYGTALRSNPWRTLEAEHGGGAGADISLQCDMEEALWWRVGDECHCINSLHSTLHLYPHTHNKNTHTNTHAFTDTHMWDLKRVRMPNEVESTLGG